MKKFLFTSVVAAAVMASALTTTAEDKKAKKAEKSDYPLTTCVVSGEKLGEMGKPYTFKYEGKEVRLCCESCKKDFKKDPAQYLKKIDDAKKQASK